jgi:hypothetical protein
MTLGSHLDILILIWHANICTCWRWSSGTYKPRRWRPCVCMPYSAKRRQSAEADTFVQHVEKEEGSNQTAHGLRTGLHFLLHFTAMTSSTPCHFWKCGQASTYSVYEDSITKRWCGFAFWDRFFSILLGPDTNPWSFFYEQNFALSLLIYEAYFKKFLHSQMTWDNMARKHRSMLKMYYRRCTHPSGSNTKLPASRKKMRQLVNFIRSLKCWRTYISSMLDGIRRSRAWRDRRIDPKIWCWSKHRILLLQLCNWGIQFNSVWMTMMRHHQFTSCSSISAVPGDIQWMY